jgi:hypothetical protein
VNPVPARASLSFGGAFAGNRSGPVLWEYLVTPAAALSWRLDGGATLLKNGQRLAIIAAARHRCVASARKRRSVRWEIR